MGFVREGILHNRHMLNAARSQMPTEPRVECGSYLQPAYFSEGLHHGSTSFGVHFILASAIILYDRAGSVVANANAQFDMLFWCHSGTL